MIACVRTTFDLADGLMAPVKAKAREEWRTAPRIVEEALCAYLAAEQASSTVDPLPSRGSPDGRVLVDSQHKDALGPALDEPA